MTDEINLDLDEALSNKFDELNAVEEREEEVIEEPEESPEPEGEPEGELEAEGVEAKKEAPEEDIEDQFKLPPTTWTKEAKEQYASLPGWAKQQVHKREQDSIAGFRNLNTQLQELQSVFAPHQEYFRANNISPQAAFNDAIQLSKNLRQANPQERGRILRSLAEQVGADLGSLNEEVPEQAKYLQQYLQPLMQKVGHLEQTLTSQQRQGGNEVQVIADFRSAKGEDGKPKYPFFDAVEERMVMEIPLIRQQNPGLSQRELLEQAYEQAVWATPDTRNLIQSEQAAKKEAERRAQAEARAAELEKANKANLNKRGGRDGTAPAETMDETLSQTYDKLVANL